MNRPSSRLQHSRLDDFWTHCLTPEDRQAVDQAKRADKMGCHSVWYVGEPATPRRAAARRAAA